MRKLFIILSLLLGLNGFGQDIDDFFLSIPDSLMNNLSTKEKEILLQKKEFTPTITDTLEVIKYTLRKQDNSIILELGYETGQRGFIYWELRKWDYPLKTVYILTQSSGTPANWSSNFIISYEWMNSKFIRLKEQIPNTISIKEFLDPLTPTDTIKKHEGYYTLHCDLIFDAKNPVWRIVIDFESAKLSRDWLKYKEWEFFYNSTELQSRKIIYFE